MTNSSKPVTRWSLLATDRYPHKIKSPKREGVRSLRFYNDNPERRGKSGRLAGSIAWFDSVNEARYVQIFVEPGKTSIKLLTQAKPLANTRLVRYKNGEVFIGGGYQLRAAGYRYGKYIEREQPNVFELSGPATPPLIEGRLKR